jgi:hypothetical protein
MSRGHRPEQRRERTEFAPSDLEGRAAFLFSGAVTACGRVGVWTGVDLVDSVERGKTVDERGSSVRGEHFCLRWDGSDLMSRGVPRWRY